MNLKTILPVLTLAMTSSAWAGEGHDHGDTPVTTASATLPRFTTASERFELVGVLDGKHLTLWLDHTTDNSPAKEATLKLEIGGIHLPLETHGEGVFEATLANPMKPGKFPVIATVLDGKESTFMATGLDIHAEAEATEAVHTHGWQELALWAALVGTVLMGLVWLIRRNRLRNPRLGGAA